MMSKPSDARDSSYSADPNKGDGRGNRKKVAAFVGVVAIAAIALGLGFGLGGGDDESAENDANPTSGSEGDDVNVTDATAAAATYAPSPAGTLWTDDEFAEDLVMSTSTTEATTTAAPVDETVSNSIFHYFCKLTFVPPRHHYVRILLTHLVLSFIFTAIYHAHYVFLQMA